MEKNISGTAAVTTFSFWEDSCFLTIHLAQKIKVTATNAADFRFGSCSPNKLTVTRFPTVHYRILFLNKTENLKKKMYV